VTDTLKRFMSDETGADLIEYALLVGLLSMACFLTLTSVGTSVKTFLGALATKVASIAP
jgi:Flp pilus assembly pilin Flp